MPHVSVGDLRFHVLRLGPRDGESTAPPAVMVHGLFTGTMASWFFTCAPAVAKTRPVLLYDLRGHGRTDAPADGDHRSVTQSLDLAALTADLPRFHLVAHSFGALIAIRYAVAHADRLASLTLVEPPVRADGPGARAWWWDTAREEGRDDAPEAMRSSLADEAEVGDDDLAALPRPLAVVLGARSPAAGLSGRAARVRPDAEVVTFDAGHAVQVDAKDELSAFLTAFLGRADTAAAPPGEEVAYG